MKKCILAKAAVCGIVSILLLNVREARAQRTIAGQMFVSADFMAAVHPRGSHVVGGEAFVGQYRGAFYWMGGLQHTPATERVNVGCTDVAGGVMYRLVDTRNRMLNIYAGGLALVGLDYPKGRKPVEDLIVNPDTGAIDTSGEGAPSARTAFVVGVEPRLELEVFPVGGFGLVGGVAAPLKFVTQQDVLSIRLYAGLRVNF